MEVTMLGQTVEKFQEAEQLLNVEDQSSEVHLD